MQIHFPAGWLSPLPSSLLTIVFAFIWSCALFLLEAFRGSHLLYKASYPQVYHSNIHYGSSAHREPPFSKEKDCSVAKPEDTGSQASLPGFPCVPKGIEECTLQSLEFHLRLPVGGGEQQLPTDLMFHVNNLCKFCFLLHNFWCLFFYKVTF